MQPAGMVRQRLEEMRSRVRERLRAVRPGSVSGEVVGPAGIIGGGRVLETVREQVNVVTARFKERKPMIVPKVTEAIAQWRPGARVKELMPSESVPLRGGATPPITGGVAPSVTGGAIRLRE